MNIVHKSFIICIFTVLICSNSATDKQNLIPFSEYFLEHETSLKSVQNYLNNSKNKQSPYSKVGCKSCTKFEYHYCTGVKLIDDHCCCDKKHYEALPYILHSCYAGDKRCSTIARNCEEYTRIRTCCCESILLGNKIARTCLQKSIIVFILIWSMFV